MTGGVQVEEQAFFTESRAALLKDHLNKWALIVGRKVLGVYDTPDQAYAEGLKAAGNVPMLVTQIVPEQQIVRHPALQFGLVDARF